MLSVHKILPLYLCLLVISIVIPSVLGTELSIVATADSYTDNDDPDVNYGGTSNLYSYNYTYNLFNETYNHENHIWLKFDLSGIPSEATVSSITLRMHTNIIGTYSTNKVGVFLCSNTTWQEMTITWNNCPEATGQPIDTVYVGTANKNYDFDVTSAVKGKSVVTLVLKTLETTDLAGFAVFESREGYSDNRPRLIVDYTTPSQQLYIDPSVLLIGGLVVIVVVIGAIYGLTRRGKKPAPPKTTPRTPPTTS